MTSRPRRSTASTSYTHLLTPLALSDSSSSSSSGDDQPTADAKGKGKDTDKDKKKKKKRKPVYIPEDSSGSEFELPDKPAGSGGDGGAADETDDDDDGGTALDSDDDLEGGESVSGASALSGSIVGDSPPRSVGGGGRGQGRGRGRGRGAARGAGRKPSTAVVVTAAASAQRTGSGVGGIAPPRAKPPANHPPSALGVQHSYIGPLAVMSPSVGLEGAGKGGAAKSFDEGRAGGPRVLRDQEVDQLLEDHTGNPYGVEADEVRDMAYVPGRFEAIGEGGKKVRERERWGGWYDEVQVRAEDIQAVPADDVPRFLPVQVYPNRPSTIFTPSVPLPGSAEAAATSTAAPSTAGSPAPGASAELPVPPPEFAAAGSSTSAAQAGQADAPNGKIRIKCGSLTTKGAQADEQTLELERFETRRLDEIINSKPGHVFNAGAPMGSLSWAPRTDAPVDKEYLLVTTTSTPDAPLRHHPCSSTAPLPSALLQLWSVPSSFALSTTAEDDSRMACELALCVDGLGECTSAAWCPLGGHAAATGKGKGKAREDAMEVDGEEAQDDEAEGRDKLGLVAGVFGDGSAAVLVVPDPTRARTQLGTAEGEIAYVKTAPLLRLRLPDTSIYSLAWGGHEQLAAGCSNGYIAVWRVGDVLRSGKQPDRPLRPTHYFAAHTALIRQLVFVSTPPPSLANRAAHDLAGAPTGIVSVAYDGSAVLSDVREPGGGGTVLTHERTPITAVAFSPHTGLAYVHDLDDRIKALGLKPSMQGNEGRITTHRGAVSCIAASPHHALVLSTALDGSAIVASGVRALRKRRTRGHFATRLFRLEVERTTGDVRMWDNLDVEYRTALDPYNPSAKATAAVASATALERATPAWPPEQAVTAAAWHPALGRASLCATGTAIGLGRVDWAEGTRRAREKAATT